jgi:hypothetical protein
MCSIGAGSVTSGIKGESSRTFQERSIEDVMMSPKDTVYMELKFSLRLYIFYLFLDFLFLRQGLTVQPRLASNSWSSCLHLLRAGIIRVYPPSWLL